MARPDLKYAVVNANTIADATIVAAVAGMKIVVVSYTLVHAAANTTTWKSNATAISGPLGAGAAVALPVSGTPESPLFETAVGEALKLGLTAAAQVSGHVTYFEDPYGA